MPGVFGGQHGGAFNFLDCSESDMWSLNTPSQLLAKLNSEHLASTLPWLTTLLNIYEPFTTNSG